jgi:hypothetical protein
VVSKLAAAAGLVFSAQASQERPHFHAATRAAFEERPRREHLLLLTRAG